jgi:hypothetical protein
VGIFLINANLTTQFAFGKSAERRGRSSVQKKSHICGALKIPCRERAVTVPKFAEGKSKFMFGESIQ